MDRIQNTAITDANITSAALVDTYTAAADRELYIQIYLTGLAGNGAYRACLTKQPGGAGPAYQSPTSSVHVADTVTTAYLPTIAIPVQSGDVVKVYVEGQAGDTAVDGAVETFDAAAGLSTLDAAGIRTAVGLASANLDTQIGDLPTNAELTSALAAADDAVLAAIGGLNDLDSTEAQAAAAAALAAYDPPTNAELTSAVSPLATAASIAALNDLSAAEVNAEVVDVLRTDTIPDSYATDGAQPTVAQALLMIWQFLTEKEVSSTTVTVNKPDGSTAAMTFTLDDASNPTTITRAS